MIDELVGKGGRANRPDSDLGEAHRGRVDGSGRVSYEKVLINAAVFTNAAHPPIMI